MRCNQTYNGLLQVHLWTHESALVHFQECIGRGSAEATSLDHHPYMDKGFGDACLDEDGAAVSSKPPYHANPRISLPGQ